MFKSFVLSNQHLSPKYLLTLSLLYHKIKKKKEILKDCNDLIKLLKHLQISSVQRYLVSFSSKTRKSSKVAQLCWKNEHGAKKIINVYDLNDESVIKIDGNLFSFNGLAVSDDTND